MNNILPIPIIAPQLDRFTSNYQFTFLRGKDNVSELRRAFVDTAKQINPTHYLTFNFYADYSMDRAQKIMDKWYVHMHNKLFRTHPSELPAGKTIPMFGFPEYTARGHIHYHTVARINAGRLDGFLKVAASKWKAIVRTGELHIQDVYGGDVGLEDMTVYSTKSNSHCEWYIPEHYKGEVFDPTTPARQRLH